MRHSPEGNAHHLIRDAHGLSAGTAAATTRLTGKRCSLLTGLAAVLAAVTALVAFAAWRSTHAERPLARPSVVDIGFSQAMSIHHQQAVTMSHVVEQASGVSSRIKQIAGSIATVQLQQIGTMQGWLELWDQPPVPRGDQMQWMEPVTVHDPGMAMASTPMPGMARQTEINRLASLHGGAADVLFLQLMIRHHQGGVEMAEYAAKHASVAPVRSLAGAMALDESQEITLMRNLLALYGAQPLAFSG